jgi:hypothetical protein
MQEEPLYVANWVVAIVLPSTPFVEGINAADPFPADAKITPDDARDKPSTFLIPTDSSDDSDQPLIPGGARSLAVTCQPRRADRWICFSIGLTGQDLLVRLLYLPRGSLFVG